MKSSVQRTNNFNVIRFIAAIMVMAGHMSYIMGIERPTLLAQEIQTIGVKIFFLIGGYLIAKSWMRDSNILRYAIKRTFRIIPALMFYTFLATFVFGAIISTLSLKDYYTNSGTYAYLKNVGLFVVYALPGCFTDNVYPYAVNGSLWTLPVEAFLYLLVPVIMSGIVGFKQNDSRKQFRIMLLLTSVICVFQIIHMLYFPLWRCVVYGTDIAQACELIPYYFIGMLFIYSPIHKILNLQVAIIFLLATASLKFGIVGQYIIMYTIFPYFVFSFSFTSNPFFSNFMSQYEISYGMYLWGFFVQQTVEYYLLQAGIILDYLAEFAICLCITLVISFISCILVEKPAQRLLKSKLVGL